MIQGIFSAIGQIFEYLAVTLETVFNFFGYFDIIPTIGSAFVTLPIVGPYLLLFEFMCIICLVVSLVRDFL